MRTPPFVPLFSLSKLVLNVIYHLLLGTEIEEGGGVGAQPAAGKRNAKGFSDLTVSAILDERKMQSIAEAAVQSAVAQLKDRSATRFPPF